MNKLDQIKHNLEHGLPIDSEETLNAVKEIEQQVKNQRITMDTEQIKELAESAGLRISESDEDEDFWLTEYTIVTNCSLVDGDTGESVLAELSCYATEYPEEGSW